MKGYAIQLNDTNDGSELCDLKVDIKRDSEGKIVSGLSIGSTLEQNKALLLILQPGELKERPTIGVGINDMLLGADLLAMRHKIRKNFAADGLTITELKLYQTNKISIKANY
jgi:hypothetical protein